MKTASEVSVSEAVRRLREAAAAKKCWRCGCFHQALQAIEREIPEGERGADLDAALAAGRERLEPVRYDCLGCRVCFPAIALNALEVTGDSCPTEPVTEREGWPPLPGDYTVLRYRAPVAVCTLTDGTLAGRIAEARDPAVSVVGTLQTENLGIERVIRNVLANPHIRFLVLCGADSRRAIGHLPGQSLLALAAEGVDSGMRIVGAPGKRPLLRNLSTEWVEQFRRVVEVIDRIDEESPEAVLEAVHQVAARDPGPASPAPFVPDVEPPTIRGYVPERMVSDPAGYFVVYPDPRRRTILLEHYGTDGTLDTTIEGKRAGELYTAAIDRGFLSRLDHAAYLGRELAKAERALLDGTPYVQDGAPERAPAGKSPSGEGCTTGDKSCCGGGTS